MLDSLIAAGSSFQMVGAEKMKEHIAPISFLKTLNLKVLNLITFKGEGRERENL